MRIMQTINAFIESHLPLAWLALVVSFAVLAKSTDMFVDSSVTLAKKLKIPRLIIGIVLVSFATTVPELSVSLLSALQDKPAMALGNAIGSVICNSGLAFALAGVISVSTIPIIPHVLKTSGFFLLFIEILTFLFVLPDNTLNRWEGSILVILFAAYMIFLFLQHKKGRFQEDLDKEEPGRECDVSMPRLFVLFLLSLGGIVLASEFIITSATTIARSFGVPEGIIALTLVALGTSIPEIATCITAARKNEGALAVGNILGANIMDICWVAGASAIANNLTLSKKEIFFMFPWMFVIIGMMLLLLRVRYDLSRKKGLILFGLYLLYLVSFFFFFPPHCNSGTGP